MHTAVLLLLGCLALALAARGAAAGPAVFDVRSYGGVPDGTTVNTAAFRAAVAAAARAAQASGAGSQVLVDGGVYLTGQVRLLSNVVLNITQNSVLLGSANQTDFPTDASQWALVFAENESNIGIVGAGTVDGQQPLYIGGWDAPNDKFVPKGWYPGECQGECRPRNIRFRSCTNIVLRGESAGAPISVVNSPDWTIHMENSTNVFVQFLRQYGDRRWPNNDGIDPDSSRNVTILDSSFDTGDDGVCIKSTVGFQVSSDVLVRNVTIRSRSSAIKFGSNTDTDCFNMLFENITIWDSHRGLGIQQRSQGNVYNITFRDITVETRYEPLGWWGAAEPIYVSSMVRAPGLPIGVTSNITFEQITARSENSAFLSGLSPGNILQNILLKNVSITIDKWSNYSLPVHEYDPTSAYNPSKWYAPVDGVYVERAEGVVFDTVSVTWTQAHKQPYWTGICFNTTNAGFPVTLTNTQCKFL